MSLDELLKGLTWEAVKTPAILGLAVAVVMVFFGKPLLDLLFTYFWKRQHGEEPVPEDWPLRGIITNIVVLSICLIFAVGRMWGEWPGFGAVFMLALMGALTAVGSYEAVKNLLKSVGIDISRIQNILL
jgi:hypothetical protein